MEEKKSAISTQSVEEAQSAELRQLQDCAQYSNGQYYILISEMGTNSPSNIGAV